MQDSSALYVKPVQTGFPADSDGRLVAAAAGCAHTLGEHARACAGRLVDTAEGKECGSAAATTLFAWEHAVSPHLAAQREGRNVSDAQLLDSVRSALHAYCGADTAVKRRVAIVETAGGVCSPAPSGTLQVSASCARPYAWRTAVRLSNAVVSARIVRCAARTLQSFALFRWTLCGHCASQRCWWQTRAWVALPRPWLHTRRYYRAATT